MKEYKMSNTPIKIDRYIKFSVKQPLNKNQINIWFDTVRNNAPSGVMATVQTTDNNGNLRSVSLLHQERKKGNSYLIPLTRNLLPDEVQKIVDAYVVRENNLHSFDIETNDTRIEKSERDGISISDERHLALCQAMAKARHETWMKERLDGGWRYGADFSMKEKTHPLLRPWSELPDKFRQPDLESPQAIFDLIAKQGYVIIPRDELERLKHKAKSS